VAVLIGGSVNNNFVSGADANGAGLAVINAYVLLAGTVLLNSTALAIQIPSLHHQPASSRIHTSP
jgi:hypothetical protein